MSDKIVTVYSCANCGAQFSKWSGRCLDCGAWGSLKQETISKSEKSVQAAQTAPADLLDLSRLEAKATKRIKANIGEIDRVFGGGLVPGSLVLLAGEPGIGKSTLLAQLANALTVTDNNNSRPTVVYVSGEESAGQVRDRMKRLHCDLAKIKFIGGTNVESIVSRLASEKPKVAIIDSIQTMSTSLLSAEAGSITQIRASASYFLELAKKNNIAVIITGHITKDGQVAGPKSLEHIVDTVLYLELETSHNFRVLKATKNRFGSVNEIGVLEMTATGFKEIKNPSSLFIDDAVDTGAGSVISVIMEGTRPFLVEIQALVSKTPFGYPQRKASGYDSNRLQVLSAVLNRRANINLLNQDIILNIVGGMKIIDPAVDLAVCLAIVSSLLNQKISRNTVVVGEVGLGGEIRNVVFLKERLKEAKALGFKNAIIPAIRKIQEDIKFTAIKTVADIVGKII